MEILEQVYCPQSAVPDGVLGRELRTMYQELATPFERRSGERFALRAALTVIDGTREFPAFTQNMSNRGVYFCVATGIEALQGQDLEFVVDLPPEITLSVSCSVRCLGRVVRSEKTAWNETGVAAEILSYAIVRDGSDRD